MTGDVDHLICKALSKSRRGPPLFYSDGASCGYGELNVGKRGAFRAQRAHGQTLLCVAVCCGVLQRVAVCCSVLQGVARCCV